MFFEFFDIKRPAWDADTLASLLQRLQESGYQGLVTEYHQLVGRFSNAQADRTLGALLFRADDFSDVLVPPAHPQARVILHRRQSDLLRILAAARTQHEARLVTTALKLHLEHVLDSAVGDFIADEGDRANLTRFRRDVVPALHLAGDGEHAPEIRNPLAAQLLRAMRQQPVVRGRPTLVMSQLATIAPDRPAEYTRDALDQLASEGVLERWHVVVCRETGQWLGSTASAEEMRSVLSLNMECPHCGRRMSEEQSDIAYRLGEQVQAYLSDNRWMCDLVETALRRLGVDAVAVHPGAGPVDGAACYHGSVILFRAKDELVEMTDLIALQEQGRVLEGEGWRVFPLLVTDRPVGLDTRGAGVTVVESVAALDLTLEQVLKAARDSSLSRLLPPILRPAGVAVADVLPPE